MLLLQVHPVVSVSKLHLDTCSTTKKKNNTQDKDGDTHLEGNIIILVNRSASLQHIFWRPVFSLLVRQRCLPCGHRNAKKRARAEKAKPQLSLRDVSKERKETRTVCVWRSVPVSASLQPLCSHYCVWPQNDHQALPEERGRRRRRRRKKSLSKRRKRQVKTWKTNSGGV